MINITCKNHKLLAVTVYFLQFIQRPMEKYYWLFSKGDDNFIVDLQKCIIPAVLYETTHCLSKVVNYYIFSDPLNQLEFLFM